MKLRKWTKAHRGVLGWAAIRALRLYADSGSCDKYIIHIRLSEADRPAPFDLNVDDARRVARDVSVREMIVRITNTCEATLLTRR